MDSEVNKFVSLLENKKIKQAKIYIDRIANLDSKAEEIVAKALQRCMVQKKTTPLGLTSSLYIYKEILIQSQFDYLESSAFNQKIHKFIYQICQYNPKAPFEERGKNYFKDTLKVELDNSIELYGKTAVILALQIVKSMAQWYPKDYQSNEDSRYALYYKKLKEKGVIFPQKQDQSYIKPDDKKKFIENHKMWIQRMEQLEDEQEDQTPQAKKQIKQPAKFEKTQKQESKVAEKINTSKPSEAQKQRTNQNNTKSLVTAKPNEKAKSQMQVKQKEAVSEVKQKATVEQVGETIKEQPVNKSKVPQTVTYLKQQGQPQFILIQNNSNPLKSRIPLSKQIPQVVTYQQITDNTNKPNLQIIQPPKISSVKQERMQNNPLGNSDQSQAKIQTKQQRQADIQTLQVPSKANIGKSKIMQQIIKQPLEKSNGVQQKSSRVNQTKIQKSIQEKRVKRKTQKPFNLVNEAKFILTPQGLKKQSESKQKKISSRTQINFRPKNNLNDQNKSPTKTNEISRKLMKTEKHTQLAQLARKSLPKTEKRLNYTINLPFNTPFANLSPEQKQNFILQNNGKTLSNLREIKNKIKAGQPFFSNPITKQPLLQIIEKANLNQVIIPFLPKYFQPVDLDMQALILESLRIGSHPSLEPSKPFYKSDELAVRLIKSSGSYILSIHNIGLKSVQVSYSQTAQAKYGNSFSHCIKLKSFDKKNSEETIVWKANPNDFVDIPFDFLTNDPNFKFLVFIIAIDNRILSLNLPITLLDQGKVDKYFDYQSIDSFINLHGRIIKSTPINLRFDDNPQYLPDLPNFFAKSKNKDSKILGQMTYSIQLNASTIVKILIWMERSSDSPSRYQTHALYNNRLQINEDFAKVLLELVCFLLCKQD